MLKPGEVLQDRYRIEAHLGTGGMAEVYKVWDKEMSTYLALKLLRADMAEDKIFLRRFKREAKTLSNLQHPNIVRFYGLEISEQYAYMLLDFIDGITLRKKIYDLNGPMGIGEVLSIFTPVCSALQFAHKKGMVHNDVKPANIMIHDNGTVLLTDFGIARMTEGTTMTLAGAGTPAYMAPEQCQGMDATPRTDIYALGIVLYELLTGGERPFTGDRAKTTGTSGEKVRWEQINARPRPPRKYNTLLPLKLEKIVLKCLSKDPAERYQSVMDLLNDLTKIQQGDISRETKTQSDLNLDKIQDAVSEDIGEGELVPHVNDDLNKLPPTHSKTAEELFQETKDIAPLVPGWICPKCGEENRVYKTYCKGCGTVKNIPAPEKRINCHECGAENKSSESSCASCGAILSKPSRSNGCLYAVLLLTFLIVIFAIIYLSWRNNPKSSIYPTANPIQRITDTQKPFRTSTTSPSMKATLTAQTQTALAAAHMTENIRNCDVVDKLPVQVNWPIKYCNMFNSDLDWSTGMYEDEWAIGNSIIQDGSLVSEITAKKGFIYRSEIYTIASDEFVISMNIYNQGNGKVNSGLILFPQGSDVNVFTIIQEYQQFGLFFLNTETNNWFTSINFAKSSAIKSTGYNRLTIIQKNGRIEYYINDRQIHVWESSPISDATFGFGIGMYDPGTQVEFMIDDFVVLAP